MCFYVCRCTYCGPCMCVFAQVCVRKKPYGLQNVLADDGRSGFENMQSCIWSNRKRQMKNKEKKKDNRQLSLHILLLNLLEQARPLSAGRFYLTTVFHTTQISMLLQWAWLWIMLFMATEHSTLHFTIKTHKYEGTCYDRSSAEHSCNMCSSKCVMLTCSCSVSLPLLSRLRRKALYNSCWD